MIKKSIFSFLLLMILSSVSFSEEMVSGQLKVNRSAICENVENREPVNSKESFVRDERGWFFTEVLNGSEGRYIYHVWNYHDGDKVFEMARIKLRVNGKRWRTWSNKNLFKTGTWSVEVSDEDGNILASKEFEVKNREDIETNVE